MVCESVPLRVKPHQVTLEAESRAGAYDDQAVQIKAIPHEAIAE